MRWSLYRRGSSLAQVKTKRVSFPLGIDRMTGFTPKEGSSMRVALYRVAGLMMVLAVALPAAAQFGHPLKGAWTGDWGTSRENRTHVVLALKWDGKTITATINPGPNSVTMQ